MNQEIKERWVAALRSGEYKQGRGSLNKGDFFCCLGVLCDLAAKEGLVDAVVDSGLDLYSGGEVLYSDKRNREDASNLILPDVVKEWAGLDENNPSVNSSGTLAELNDQGYDFEYIAATIENQL